MHVANIVATATWATVDSLAGITMAAGTDYFMQNNSKYPIQFLDVASAPAASVSGQTLWPGTNDVYAYSKGTGTLYVRLIGVSDSSATAAINLSKRG